MQEDTPVLRLISDSAYRLRIFAEHRHQKVFMVPVLKACVRCCSGSMREVPVADVIKESLGCLFHQIQDPFESIGAAGVGVGDLAFR